MKFRNRVFAPGPTPVPEESRQSMSRSPGYHRTPHCSEIIREVRARLAELLGTDAVVVPVSSSGTGAMEMAVQNFGNVNDDVLTIEAGKFGRRWTRMCRKRGYNVETVDVPRDQPVDPDTVLRRIEDHSGVRTVYATMVETSTLARHPIEEIGDLLTGRDIIFVVDAISAVGAEPFYPDEHGVDVVLMGAQKGIMGPPGLAFLSVNSPARKRSKSVDVHETYFDVEEHIQRLEKDGQTPWTPPMQLLNAVRSSLQMMSDEGYEEVFCRHRRLSRVCRRSVQSLGLDVFPRRPAVAGTAVEVPESINALELQKRIHSNYGIYLPGGRGDLKERLIRIGHLGEVDYFDVITVLAAIEQALIDFDFNTKPGTALTSAQKAFRESG